MLLACPFCRATFRVPEGAIPESGRTVRCAKCKHEWHATIPHAEMETPAAPTLTEVEELLRKKQEAAETIERAKESSWATMPQEADAEISEDPRFIASAMAATADEAHSIHTADDAFQFDKDHQEEVVQEEDTYHVTEEEMQAFAGLVSQEELDAIPTTSVLEALTGEKIEEIPDFDAVLAQLEEGEPHAIPKLRPLRSKAKGKENDDEAEEKIIVFPTLTKYIGYATAAMLLIGIIFSLIGYNLEIRRNLPVAERFYSLVGYPSSKGIELIDMKMEKTQLPGKTTYDISGAIINKLEHSVPIPTVRIRLVDEHNQELRRWDFSQEKMMKPNESLPFTAPKLRALNGTEKDAYAFVVDIGNGLEMMLRD